MQLHWYSIRNSIVLNNHHLLALAFRQNISDSTKSIIIFYTLTCVYVTYLYHYYCSLLDRCILNVKCRRNNFLNLFCFNQYFYIHMDHFMYIGLKWPRISSFIFPLVYPPAWRYVRSVTKWKCFAPTIGLEWKSFLKEGISWYFFLNRKWNRGRTLYSRVTMRFVILIVRISKPFYFVWFGLPSGAARLIDFLHHYWPNSIWICIHIWETSFRRLCNFFTIAGWIPKV